METKPPKAKAVEVSMRKPVKVESDIDDSPSDTDEDTGNNTDSDIKKMVALLVKGIKKMKYKNSRRQSKFIKRSYDAGKDMYKKRDDTDSKRRKVDMTQVKCYNCDKVEHFAADCKKTKKSKGISLISSSKDWMDSSDSEEEEVINYALMANADECVNPENASSSKVYNPICDFDTDNISELKSFLKSLHISFRTQTTENTRILSEMSDLKKKNDHLEIELVLMLEIKKECEKAKYSEVLMTAKYANNK